MHLLKRERQHVCHITRSTISDSGFSYQITIYSTYCPEYTALFPDTISQSSRQFHMSHSFKFNSITDKLVQSSCLLCVTLLFEGIKKQHGASVCSNAGQTNASFSRISLSYLLNTNTEAFRVNYKMSKPSTPTLANSTDSMKVIHIQKCITITAAPKPC